MKTVLTIFLLLFLTSCARNYEAYFSNLSDQQIAQIPNKKLCKMVNKTRSTRYTGSEKVIEEMHRRGLMECSKMELHCVSLGFKPQSKDYTTCMMSRGGKSRYK